MCRFADWLQGCHEKQTRSLRIGGHCTSIRLERSFWETLEEIGANEEMSLSRLLTTLHGDVLDRHGEVKNFASLLRCACLIYCSNGAASSRALQGGDGGSTQAKEGGRIESLGLIGRERNPVLLREQAASVLLR